MRILFTAAMSMTLGVQILGTGTGFVGTTAWAAGKLVCETGPAKRRFGGTLWLVYACSDERSLGFRPEQNNPNNSAQFVLRWTGSQYELEGTPGDKPDVAQKAYDDIALLSDTQIGQLIAAAKAAD